MTSAHRIGNCARIEISRALRRLVVVNQPPRFGVHFGVRSGSSAAASERSFCMLRRRVLATAAYWRLCRDSDRSSRLYGSHSRKDLSLILVPNVRPSMRNTVTRESTPIGSSRPIAAQESLLAEMLWRLLRYAQPTSVLGPLKLRTVLSGNPIMLRYAARPVPSSCDVQSCRGPGKATA